MELGDELAPGKACAWLRAAQLDGRPHGVDVVGLGGERPGPAVAEQGLDEGAKPATGHGSTSASRAAWRSARCWSTLALPTLTFMAWAASRREQDCKNRSSRIRRYRGGRAAMMRAIRCGASDSAGMSSRSGRSSAASIAVTWIPNVRR